MDHSLHKDTELYPGIKICVLISGIANVLWSLVFIASCYLSFVAILLITLAIFEFIYFAQADKKPLQDALAHAKVLGILEIVCILTCNVASLVCGILVLVFLGNQKA